MTIRTWIKRRQFLVGTGAALTQAVFPRGPSRADQAPRVVTKTVQPKPGIAPGYIISGRGEHSHNPYFQPQGGPSYKRVPTPPAVHGTGVDEDRREK